jgi:hypothetical protein
MTMQQSGFWQPETIAPMPAAAWSGTITRMTDGDQGGSTNSRIVAVAVFAVIRVCPPA